MSDLHEFFVYFDSPDEAQTFLQRVQKDENIFLTWPAPALAGDTPDEGWEVLIGAPNRETVEDLLRGISIDALEGPIGKAILLSAEEERKRNIEAKRNT